MLERNDLWGTGGGIDYKYHLKFLANAVNCSQRVPYLSDNNKEEEGVA